MKFWKYILLLLLSVACGQRVKFQRTEPVTVKVEQVSPVAEESSLSYVGRVEAGGSTTFTSPYPGTLTKLSARDGQRVRQGEVLAVVSSEAVKSAHLSAKATLRQAEDAYQRVSKLYESGSIPEMKKVEVESQLEQARSAEAATRQALQDGTLRAPFSGVVTEVYAHRGVSLPLAAPILRLMDVDGLEVRFPVPENEIAGLSVGEAVSIEVPAAGKTLDAALSSKGVVASPLSHTYECVVKVRDSGILPGMVCKVRLRRPGGTAVIVPSSALRTGERGRYVWCVVDGKVERRTVVTSGFSGEGVVITDGLKEGDLVVIEGGRKVSSGMQVQTVWN